MAPSIYRFRLLSTLPRPPCSPGLGLTGCEVLVSTDRRGDVPQREKKTGAGGRMQRLPDHRAALWDAVCGPSENGFMTRGLQTLRDTSLPVRPPSGCNSF